MLGYIVILACMRLADRESGPARQTNSDLTDVIDNAEPTAKRKRGMHTFNGRLSYGWRRAEVTSAFFNGSFLVALSLSVFLQALDRFVNPEGQNHAPMQFTSTTDSFSSSLHRDQQS